MPKKTLAPAPDPAPVDDSVIEYDEALEPGADSVAEPETAAATLTESPTDAPAPKAEPATSKLAVLEALLVREEGATLAQMVEATGWQEHSVRGALAGGLKKRGLSITSVKPERVYRAENPTPATGS